MNFFRRTSLLIVCLSVHLFSLPQSVSLVDSLKSKLVLAKDDTSKVRILGKLSYQYFKIDTDTGILYAEQGIELAQKLNWELGQAFSYNYLGINYGVKGNYPKSLEYFQHSLAHFRKTNDQLGTAQILNNLSNLYRIIKKYRESIDYIQQAIVINTATGNQRELMNNYNNLGATYSDMAVIDKSNEFLSKGLAIAKRTGHKTLEVQFYINLAENMMKQCDYCGAINMTENAIVVTESTDLPYDLASYKSFLVEIMLKAMEDMSSGKHDCKFYKRGKNANLQIAKSLLHGAIENLKTVHDQLIYRDIYLSFSRIYELQNDHKKALVYYKKFTECRDSLFSKDNALKIAELEKQQEVEIRDQKIHIQQLEIERKNFLLYLQIFIFIMVLGLVVSFVFSYNRRKQLRKQIKLSDELRIAKERAEESDRLKSAFLANLSHEIRTPLNSIMGFSEMLKDPTLPADERLSYFNVMVKSGTRLLGTLNELVEISRIQTGQLVLQTEKVDLNREIDILEGIFKTEITNKGLKFIVRKPPVAEPVVLVTDRVKLKGVFTHLLLNAIKYTHEGTIEAGYEIGDEIRFFVTDTGIGIPADRHKAIFNQFVQADIEDIKAFQGLGLGLTIAKAYVELMGGRIWVESEVGKGATFNFSLSR